MKVLFTGDSITEGKIGCNYIDMIIAKDPSIKAENLGLGGDTIYGVSNRTIEHLRKTNDYDVIVVAAGHNDIIIPTFDQMSFIHKSIAGMLKERGSIPSKDIVEFKQSYAKLIKKLNEVTDSRIIVTTLSVINEEKSYFANILRKQFNDVIKGISRIDNVTLADVGKEFDDYLSEKETTDFFIENAIDNFLKGKRRINNEDNGDKRIRMSELHLTIDGAHMNHRGAKIYCDTILKGLKEHG